MHTCTCTCTCTCKQAIGAREAALREYNGAAATLAARKERLEKARVGGLEEKLALYSREAHAS